MLDILVYFRTEIEAVGRHWGDIAAALSDAQALRRPAADINHALWLTGHMAWAEDCLLVQVPTGNSFRRKEWDGLFDHTSEKLPDDQYPPWREVRTEYARVHAEVVRHLSKQGMNDLARASVLEKQWLPTASHSIAHQVTHGHYHLGQLVYLQKLLHPVTAAQSGRGSPSALQPKV
jgi:hypothetical protein